MAEETMLGKFYFYQVELRVFPVAKVKKESVWNGSTEGFGIEFFLCAYVNSVRSKKCL